MVTSKEESNLMNEGVDDLITNEIKIRLTSTKAQKSIIFFSFFVLPILYIPIALFRTDINYSAISFMTIPGIMQPSDALNFLITGIIGTLTFLSTKELKQILNGHYELSASEYKTALLIHRVIPRFMYTSIAIFPTILGILLINAQFNFTLIREPKLISALFAMFIPSLMIGFFAGLHLTFHEKGRHFGLNLAKTYLKTITPQDSSIEKIRILMNTIKEYDDYIFYQLKNRIGSLKTIQTKILFESNNLDSLITNIDKEINSDDRSLIHYLRTEFKIADPLDTVYKPSWSRIIEFVLQPKIMSLITALLGLFAAYPEIRKVLVPTG